MPGRCRSLISLVALGLSSCAGVSGPGTGSSAPIAQSAAEAAKPKTEALEIAFDEGGVRLSTAAIAQLDTAARLYRDARPEVMIVAGHSDATGTEYENLLLSARRANVVKMALVSRGIPTKRLEIVAIGSAQPVIGVVPSRSAVVTWR